MRTPWRNFLVAYLGNLAAAFLAFGLVAYTASNTAAAGPRLENSNPFGLYRIRAGNADVGPPVELLSVLISDSAKAISAASSDEVVRVWRFGQSDPIWSAPCANEHIALSPDGFALFFNDKNGYLSCFDLRMDHAAPRRVSSKIMGRRLFAISGRATLLVQEGFHEVCYCALKSRQERHVVLSAKAEYDVSTEWTLSADGRYLAVHALKLESPLPKIIVWDLDANKLVVNDTSAGTEARFIQFHPRDNSLIIVGEELTSVGPPGARQGRRLISRCLAETVKAMAVSADGRIIALADRKGTIHLVDHLTGQTLATLQSGGRPTSLAFSPNSRLLISGDVAAAATVWNLVKIMGPPNNRTDAKIADLWEDLGADDARRAHAAVLALSLNRTATLEYVRKHVRRVVRPNAVEVSRLIAGLDGISFDERRAAHAGLKAMSDVATPAMAVALKREKLSTEAKVQLQRLIEHGADSCASPDRRRMYRLVAALEYINCPESLEILSDVALGDEAALVTREARHALAYLRNGAVE